MSKRLSHFAEYAGLRLAVALVDHLPSRVTLATARAGARCSFALDKKHRKRAIANVLRAGVTTDERRAAAIARASFESFASTIIETFRMDPLYRDGTWKQHITFDMDPRSRELIETPGQGGILLSAHLGNWEVAGRTVATMKPLTAIARNMNNPYVDRLVAKRRPGLDFRTTPKHGASTTRLVRVIRQGNVLAILADQHNPSSGALRLPVFGHEAAVYTSPAQLHLLTGAPLIFGYCIRTGHMQFNVHADPPIQIERSGNRDADVRAITEAYIASVEQAICRTPDQYLWAHRRWRN